MSHTYLNFSFWHYYLSVNTLALARRPFITSLWFIGLSPGQVQTGDFVLILIGCKVPFILRVNRRGHYCLVWEAYVHGVMDGEVVRGDPAIVNIDLY